MKKKLIVLGMVLLLTGSSEIFAFGLGIQFNGNAGEIFTPGVALTFKLDSVPLVFAANWYFGDDSEIGLTGDYWILNDKLVNVGSVPLNWFFGLGFYANAVFADEFAFNGGARIPIGLNMFIAKKIEPFLQIAPSFGVDLLPSIAASKIFFPISAGCRFWF